MQPKEEQLACFAQTFTMALELLHHCCLPNQNDGAAVEIYRLRGGNIIMRSLCNVTRAAKSDALIFSDACRKKAYQNKVTGFIFFPFPWLVDALGT